MTAFSKYYRPALDAWKAEQQRRIEEDAVRYAADPELMCDEIALALGRYGKKLTLDEAIAGARKKVDRLKRAARNGHRSYDYNKYRALAHWIKVAELIEAKREAA